MPSDLKVTSIILASMSNCYLSLTKKKVLKPTGLPQRQALQKRHFSPGVSRPSWPVQAGGSTRLQQTPPWHLFHQWLGISHAHLPA